jgi:nitrogen fixation protein
MELELRWLIKKQKKGEEVFEIHYIHIPVQVASFLNEYIPYLDLENRVIIFRKEAEKVEQERTLQLRWLVKKQKVAGKLYNVYYIHIPKQVFPLLKGYTPYLDLEKKMIIFRNEAEENRQEGTHAL